MGRRLFLSTSFTVHVHDKTGIVKSGFRTQVEQVVAALRGIDSITIFCAVEQEGWVISKEPPEISIKKDLSEIKKADLVVALLPSGSSTGGVQFEIGVAYALGKKVLVATKPDTKLGFFNQGAANLGYVEHLYYKNVASLVEQIRAAL
jgi:nucleoside 2-deoxyribosyltransferase